MELERLRLILETISYLVTILGVPAGILIYWREKVKERKEREYGTYNALDDKYIEFLNTCLENTDLNIYYVRHNEQTTLSPTQETKQLIIFEILISILERAFLMYKEQNSKIKQEQWEGWNSYMHDWMNNPGFQQAWTILGVQWETNFAEHMNQIFKEAQGSTT